MGSCPPAQSPFGSSSLVPSSWLLSKGNEALVSWWFLLPSQPRLPHHPHCHMPSGSPKHPAVSCCHVLWSTCLAWLLTSPLGTFTGELLVLPDSTTYYSNNLPSQPLSDYIVITCLLWKIKRQNSTKNYTHTHTHTYIVYAYVEDLTTISKYDLNWTQHFWKYINKLVKMNHTGINQVYNPIWLVSLWKGEIWTQRSTCTEGRQREGTLREDGHWQAKERGLEQILSSWLSEGPSPPNTLISGF